MREDTRAIKAERDRLRKAIEHALTEFSYIRSPPTDHWEEFIANQMAKHLRYGLKETENTSE